MAIKGLNRGIPHSKNPDDKSYSRTGKPVVEMKNLVRA